MDRVFTIPGFGAVVTGTLWSGVIRVGDAVEVLPSGRMGRMGRVLRDGMGKEELKGRIPTRSDPRFFGAILAALVKEGEIVVDLDLVKPASGTASPATESGEVRNALEAALRQGGSEPPTVKELSERLKSPVKTLLEHLAALVREGRSIRAASDFYHAPEPLATLRDEFTIRVGDVRRLRRS